MFYCTLHCGSFVITAWRYVRPGMSFPEVERWPWLHQKLLIHRNFTIIVSCFAYFEGKLTLMSAWTNFLLMINQQKLLLHVYKYTCPVPQHIDQLCAFVERKMIIIYADKSRAARKFMTLPQPNSLILSSATLHKDIVHGWEYIVRTIQSTRFAKQNFILP